MSGPSAAPSTHVPDDLSVRLSLKPSGDATGYVDGAWWPRSDDLDAEAPSLVQEVARDRGRPVRLSYDLSGWRAGSTRMSLGPYTVRFDGFRGRGPDLIHLTDVDHHILTLLVVPPVSSPVAAARMLHEASLRGNHDTPAMLLAPRSSEGHVSEERWESEGGHSGRE